LNDANTNDIYSIFQAGTGLAKACQWYNTINDWVFPAYVAYEIWNIGKAINKDYQNNTSRNTVEKGAQLVGVTGGGYTGELKQTFLETLSLKLKALLSHIAKDLLLVLPSGQLFSQASERLWEPSSGRLSAFLAATTVPTA
jgi:hypothetical protein